MTHFKNSGIDGLPHFLSYGTPRARLGRTELRYDMQAKELKSLCRSPLLVGYSVQSLHSNTRKPIFMNAYGCKQNSCPLGRSAVHPGLPDWFVQSVFCSFVHAGLSFGYPFVHSVCSFACFSVCAFVYVSALFGCCSVCPVLLAFYNHKHAISKGSNSSF